MTQSSNKGGYLLIIIMVATLGGLLFGYDTAVISGTVKYLRLNFITPCGWEEATANSMSGFLVGSALIGCIIGGLIAGWFSSKFGRKKSLFFAAILFIISAIGSGIPELCLTTAADGSITTGFTQELHQLIPSFVIFRIIGGIGVGMASMVSPMYIAEIAPAEKRGSLVSCNQFAIIFGMLVVYFVNYGIALSGDETWIAETGWRIMFLSENVPATLLLISILCVPESPRWLVMKGRTDEAKGVIAKVIGGERVEAELADIKASFENLQKSSILTYGLGLIVIGLLLSIFQQFVGINVVLYYAPEIFKSIGDGSTDVALLQTIIVGAVNLIFTVIAILTVDKFGRKPLLIIGSLGMAISMLMLGLFFYTDNRGLGAIIVMLTYTAAFALSWGPVCWVMLAEIFPNSIRSSAMALAVAVQWIANYLVSWTFPMMNDSTYLQDNFHGGFAYWVYAGMGVISAIFVWKMVPETKGKSLEDMEELFKK